MIKRMFFFFLFFTFILGSLPRLWTQTFSASTATASVEFDMTGFPQWAKDLRRGSIVAFGTFPFVYLISNWGFDFYRYSNHDWDRRYAPFPFAAAGAVEKTQEEMFMTLGVTAGGAIIVALVDHGIVRARRNRMAREDQKLQEGTPIIIRSPLSDDEPNKESP